LALSQQAFELISLLAKRQILPATGGWQRSDYTDIRRFPMPLTPRQIVKKIEALGWHFDRQSGSHRVFVHATKAGIIVVPMHAKDLKIGTERQILKAVGLL
jgi:mRNA interferase HicA